MFSLNVSGERQLLSWQYVSVSGHTSKLSPFFWVFSLLLLKRNYLKV